MYPERGVRRKQTMSVERCFSNFVQSKVLALATLVLVLCSILAVICCLLPFWFSLRMNLTFVDDGNTAASQQVVVKRDINCGLFFLDENRFINIIHLQKADNTEIMPVFIHLAQIFYLIGSIGVVLTAGTASILSVRDFSSPPGEICLAASATFLVLSQTLAIVLIIIQVTVDPKAEWQNLPVADYIPNRYTYYTVLSARPEVILNWGFWVACVGAGFGCVAVVGLWMHAMFSCCHLQRVRYQMLRVKPDEGSSPVIGKSAFQNMAYIRSPNEYPAMVAPFPQPPVAKRMPPPVMTNYDSDDSRNPRIGMELDL